MSPRNASAFLSRWGPETPFLPAYTGKKENACERTLALTPVNAGTVNT